MGLVAAQFRELLSSLTLMPPAEDLSIERLAHAVGAQLPPSYVEMLKVADGGEGSIGDNYIVIYPTEELIDTPYPYAEFVPGLLFFGGDGGEALFGFDVREGSDRVLVVHGDDLEPNHVVELSPSLVGFLELLHQRFWSDAWGERYRELPH